jgi:hypothetical protein
MRGEQHYLSTVDRRQTPKYFPVFGGVDLCDVAVVVVVDDVYGGAGVRPGREATGVETLTRRGRRRRPVASEKPPAAVSKATHGARGRLMPPPEERGVRVCSGVCGVRRQRVCERAGNDVDKACDAELRPASVHFRPTNHEGKTRTRPTSSIQPKAKAISYTERGFFS